jgi:uncharacterized protein with ATP-grasp and redox domains
MILEPECIGCLFDQIYKAFLLLSPETPRDKIIEVQRKLMDFLINTDLLNKPGPLIGAKTYELIAEALGEKDPYKALKDKYNRIALEYFDKAKEIIDKAEDPIFEAIAVAAIGNTIDFGAHHKIDLINDIKNFTPENLVINDIPKFKDALKKANWILILGDNAGEIVFDKLLVVTLKKIYPNLELIYSVRGAPIINDVTMEDAKFVGIDKVAKVIEAPPVPGVELEIASEEFKSYFNRVDGIILSTGQGNFESLYQKSFPNKEVYYLLKSKCILMERIFQVEHGDLIFKKKTLNF